jgi:hypothetical protein
MTEIEVLQQIEWVAESLVFMLSVIGGLLLSVLFAIAWGRNSHV